MCVVSVIVKHPVLPPSVVDGRSRNPLYSYSSSIVVFSVNVNFCYLFIIFHHISMKTIKTTVNFTELDTVLLPLSKLCTTEQSQLNISLNYVP